MATNPPIGDGHRQGAVKKRSQVYNPKTKRWEKRDAETGRIMDVKSDKKPFKGVRKEKPKHDEEHAQVAQEGSEHAEAEEHVDAEQVEQVEQENSEQSPQEPEQRQG